jgi:hypothetical protein
MMIFDHNMETRRTVRPACTLHLSVPGSSDPFLHPSGHVVRILGTWLTNLLMHPVLSVDTLLWGFLRDEGLLSVSPILIL